MNAQIARYEKTLLDKIPICKPMGVKIIEVTDRRVRVGAPLKENINYHGTVFGGSLNAIAMLTGYLMLHHLLRQNHLPVEHAVIQSGEIQFFVPTTGDFEAVCELPGDDVVAEFIKALSVKGRGRIQLTTEIRCQAGEPARVVFKGVFATKTN